nr:hypothetical protein [uncultured Flavobacterium sp.]
MENTDEKKVMVPTQLISVARGMELSSNYCAQKGTMLKTALGDDDANAVWYSLQELENYIAYIKSEGLNKGYIVDGIRFHLGLYPQEELHGKAGYTTIFLSPTGIAVGENPLASLTSREEGDGSEDITEIEPLNFGSMGNPPKVCYGG